MKKLENERMTRGREALLEGIKNNLTLDKDKIERKKQVIMIPQILNIEKQYFSMISHTQITYQKQKEKNSGYIRFFDIQDRYPKQEIYEADEFDIQFLQTTFPKDFPQGLTQREILKNPILQEFEKVIIYLEETEDQNYGSYKSQFFKFSLPTLEIIAGHWIMKCKKLKRPLLRKNWKQILFNDKYGTYNKLIKAFHPREKEKYHSRALSRMPKEEKKEILKNLHKDNIKALYIQKLLIKREQLKFLQMKTWFSDSKDISRQYQEMNKIIEQLYCEEQSYFPVQQKITPKPQIVQQKVQSYKNLDIQQPQQAVIEQQTEEIPKGIQFLLATTISLLKTYNFKLSDFTYSNIENINKQIESIQKVNKPKVKDNTSEREVFIKKSNKPVTIAQTLTLVKRNSYYDGQIILDKVKKLELLENQSILKMTNFIVPCKLQRLTKTMDSQFNGNFAINQNYLNPFMFQNTGNYLPITEVSQKLRISINEKLRVSYDYENFDKNNIFSQMGSEISGMQSQFLENLELDNRLKMYKKKKKKLC